MPYRELLASTNIAAASPPARVDRLAEAAYTRKLARGQILFVEGEPSEHLYIIVSGRMKIVVTSPHGAYLTLRVLGPGESLGELSILDGGSRSACAEALDAVELATVPASAVIEFLRADPEAALRIARDLAVTIRRLTGSTADLVFLNLPRRVAKFLLDAAPPPSGVATMHMSQTEIAAQLGATRQSFNRALGLLLCRGWVHFEPDGSVRIVDRAALSHYASS